jgi:hypothetical protein
MRTREARDQIRGEVHKYGATIDEMERAAHLARQPSMQKLSIRLQKGRDGPDILTCIRPDGSRTWQRLQRGLPVHDLVHYAVESVLGLNEGFFALVARGWDITAFEAPENRSRLTPEAIWEEFVVSLFLTELSDGVERDEFEFNATLRAMIAGKVSIAPRALTSEELAAIRAKVKALSAQWRSLAPGQTLDLGHCSEESS